MATRRNRLTLEITTAGWNRNSICYEHDEYSQKVLEGMVEDETWFAFICRADKEDRERWDDPEVWEKANPSWGVAIHEDRVRTVAKQAAELPSKLNDFLRYRLNIWTEQAERAIDMPRWIVSGENSPTMAELSGRHCFAGLDLASVQDLAAFSLVFPMEETIAALLWLWCPEVGVLKRSKEDRAPYDLWVKKNLMRATDGDTINHNAIRVDILKILESFELVALAYDPHNSGNLPHDLADVLGEEKVVKFYQGFSSMGQVLPGIFQHGRAM
jgi:phage terminase large subunit-like protein